jgi:hypothetical protein
MNNPLKTTAALIIDIENLIGGLIRIEQDNEGTDSNRYLKNLNFDIRPVCNAIIKMHGSLHFRFSIGDIFYSCKRTNNYELSNQIKRNFHDNLIVIHEVTNFDNVKDCSDFVIYTETLDLAYREKSIDSFAIVSMDKGFIPLYTKLKQLGKTVTVVGIADYLTPDCLSSVVDNIIYTTEISDPLKRRFFRPNDNLGVKDAVAPNKFTLVGNVPTIEPNPSYPVFSDGKEIPFASPFVSSGNQNDTPLVPAPSQLLGMNEEYANDILAMPSEELPSWVTMENFEIAHKIVKSVERVLRCPVLSRDHNASICQLIDSTFKLVVQNDENIQLVTLADRVTSKIINGHDIITPSDFNEYNIGNLSVDNLINKIVYKVIRTLYMADVFTKLANEDNRSSNPTLFAYSDREPALLERLFSSFFGIIKNSEERLPLEAESLTMAFHRYPTEAAKAEMQHFIDAHNMHRPSYLSHLGKGPTIQVLN